MNLMTEDSSEFQYDDLQMFSICQKVWYVYIVLEAIGNVLFFCFVATTKRCRMQT